MPSPKGPTHSDQANRWRRNLPQPYVLVPVSFCTPYSLGGLHPLYSTSIALKYYQEENTNGYFW